MPQYSFHLLLIDTYIASTFFVIITNNAEIILIIPDQTALSLEHISALVILIQQLVMRSFFASPVLPLLLCDQTQSLPPLQDLGFSHMYLLPLHNT